MFWLVKCLTLKLLESKIIILCYQFVDMTWCYFILSFTKRGYFTSVALVLLLILFLDSSIFRVCFMVKTSYLFVGFIICYFFPGGRVLPFTAVEDISREGKSQVTFNFIPLRKRKYHTYIYALNLSGQKYWQNSLYINIFLNKSVHSTNWTK